MSHRSFSLIEHFSRRHLALCMLSCLAASMSWGCLGSSSSASSELGSLELELTAQDGNGYTYRLRNADFRIQERFGSRDGGPPHSVVISSETSLGDTFLTHPLVSGAYQVTLLNGWHLERVNPANTAPPSPHEPEPPANSVPAVLLSEPTRFFSISRNRTSHVRYDFGLGDDVLAFGGELAISIRIQEPFVGIDAGTGR